MSGRMPRGIVFDVRRYSIHDGPGIRTTVFLKGCPLRCAWCHNPESQSPGVELVFRPGRCIGCRACLNACGNEALAWGESSPVTDRSRCRACGNCARVCHAQARELVGREVEAESVADEAARDLPFYEESGGGVTVSGGEPLAQAVFTIALLRALKERGIHTVLDTCGMAEWSSVEAVMPWTDLFLYDVKVMDPDRHRRFTGAGNERILMNLKALVERGAAVLVRVPLVPGVNDDPGEVAMLAGFAGALPGIRGIEILPYHAIGADKYERLGARYAMGDVQPPAPGRVREIVRVMREAGLTASGGGADD